ncbi:unnamed protein product [Effrenium voratum]|nr:unnamed protein product [Effrenium voratum]
MIVRMASKRSRRRFLFAARAKFEERTAEVLRRLQVKLGPEADASAERALSQKLTASLVDGETVHFEDTGALCGYALRRLRSRCRALLEVLLAENCGALLDAFLQRWQASTGRPFLVASLGGGPGFDLVALLATMDALQEAAAQEPGVLVALPAPNGAACLSLDLAPAWAPAVAAVAEVAKEMWPQQSPELELLAPVDLRSPAMEIAEFLPRADLVVAAYVLHENEAALTSAVPGCIGGAFPEIFQRSAWGVPLVFLDATHRLWPSLVQTAREAADFEVLLPEGLAAHIHAVVLIRGEAEGEWRPAQFETFLAHQRAKEDRLWRQMEKHRA